MAYGIRASVPWCKDAPPESKWWHDEECTYFSSSHFAAFVMKDELVGPCMANMLRGTEQGHSTQQRLTFCTGAHHRELTVWIATSFTMAVCVLGGGALMQVAHDQVVTKTFEPAFQRQRSATIELYATDDNDARQVHIRVACLLLSCGVRLTCHVCPIVLLHR